MNIVVADPIYYYTDTDDTDTGGSLWTRLARRTRQEEIYSIKASPWLFL